MKLGVFSISFGDCSFEEALDVIAANKLEAVEVGTGGFLGDVHCKVEDLIHNEEKAAIIQTGYRKPRIDYLSPKLSR